MKLSNSISVGHVRSKDGGAAVVITMDDERAAVTAAGARKIASQLLLWADHADNWKSQPEEDRKQSWQQFESEKSGTWVSVAEVFQTARHRRSTRAMSTKGPTIIPRNNPQIAVALEREAERRRAMQPHQQRVVDEKKELDEKLDRLKAFIETNPIFKTLAEDERTRLNRQFDAMAEYSNILSQRIGAF